MQVGDTAKDKGVSGFVRSVLPYGLVLWWDAEETRIHAPRKNTHGSLSRKGSAGDFSTGESFGVDHSDYADMDRIEALAMRSQMMLDSGMRLDTSRIGE